MVAGKQDHPEESRGFVVSKIPNINPVVLIVAIVLLLVLATGGLIYRYRNRQQKQLDEILTLYQQKELPRAERRLTIFLQQFPYSVEAWVLAGNLSLQLNKTTKAKHAFTKALELDGVDERALLGLGVVARRNGQYDRAEEYYYRVLKTNPHSHSAKSNLLIVEILNGNLDTAVSLGEDAWRAADKNKQEQLAIGANLVIAYHENGQPEKCRELLRELEGLQYDGIAYLHMYLDGQIALNDIL